MAWSQVANLTGPAGTTTWEGITNKPADLVYTGATQTLTGKTISAGILSGATVLPQSGTITIYNTADQVTNYERTTFRWNSNAAEIGNFYGGTGSAVRPLVLGVASGAGSATISRGLVIQNQLPYVYFGVGGSASASTAATAALIRFGNPAAQLTATTNHQTVFSVAGNTGQSGTASYTAFLVDVTETSTGSGTKRLFDAKVGGTSRFTVDNAGIVNAQSFLSNVATTATASGTTTLTASSAETQVFTGSSTQTVILPIAPTLGKNFVIINRSSSSLTVTDPYFNFPLTLPANTSGIFTAYDSSPDGSLDQWVATFQNGFPINPAAIVTLTGTQSLSNKTLTNPTVNAYTEGVVAIGTVTSSCTLAITSGTVLTATLTASTACTFTMPTVGAGKSFILMLKQAASTGNGTATFTNVRWAASTAPTITATAGRMDILSFVSDGTNWYGTAAQNFTP